MSIRKKSIHLRRFFRTRKTTQGHKPLNVERLEGRELFAGDLVAVDLTGDNVSVPVRTDLTPIDFNGDNISDIAFHRPGSTWESIPKLIANGDGQWTASNQSIAWWANQPGVNALPGDYDGDGTTDIAFHRPGSYWEVVPILFSRNGRWVETQGRAPSWANELGAKAVSGDFNRDGKTDIAVHHSIDGYGGSWLSILIAQDNGRWSDELSFPLHFDFATDKRPDLITGDFDGDGGPDIAFQESGGSVPILFSTPGDDGWGMTLMAAVTSYGAPSWSEYGEALPGDYNNDGRTDIAFHIAGYGKGWGGVPVLFSQADYPAKTDFPPESGWSGWVGTNYGAPPWATQAGTQALTGDFNGDGRTDIAFHRPGSNWDMVPVMLSTGTGWFSKHEYAAPSWANEAGAQALVGDYDGDGRSDIAFHRPGSLSNTVPILFASDNGWTHTDFAAPSWAHQPGVNAVDERSEDRSRLYLNFDGAILTAQEMDVYADVLDPENDGVRVKPFLAQNPYQPVIFDRELIISQIINRVQAELDPFGLAVDRHFGNTVENVGATTIYVGNTTLTNFQSPHVASAVDIGNDNPTDIAFVGEELWPDVNDTITAMSNLILHEAGHTYGLYHVNSVENGVVHHETMGLRYSTTDRSEWTRDTSFLNRAFSEHSNHGGGYGSQNSYQTLMANTKHAVSSNWPTQDLFGDAAHNRSLGASVDAIFAEHDHPHLDHAAAEDSRFSGENAVAAEIDVDQRRRKTLRRIHGLDRLAAVFAASAIDDDRHENDAVTDSLFADLDDPHAFVA